jgi:hypothetical protein
VCIRVLFRLGIIDDLAAMAVDISPPFLQILAAAVDMGLSNGAGAVGLWAVPRRCRFSFLR